ncbi:MAG: triose-phosphate isomerase [Verrucomicrobia bacterium]|nr:triose-phosphate isomerase [Verrucomicrobiota bacterium]
MSRKPIIAANWKMNMTPQETTDFITQFQSLVGNENGADIVIAPPFVSIAAAAALLSNSDNIRIAAQNMHNEASGAFTGEISSMMLKELFVSYVILGHSERRAIFGETDEFINRKVITAHSARLRPILCVGETLEERDAGRIEQVLTTQLTGSLADLDNKRIGDTVIAYEPVWAIGTGRTASPEQAQEAHAFIRAKLTEIADADTAARVRIQYGGSVKPSNMAELISQPDVDGALVGGASLESGSFYEIVKAAAAHHASQ